MTNSNAQKYNSRLVDHHNSKQLLNQISFRRRMKFQRYFNSVFPNLIDNIHVGIRHLTQLQTSPFSLLIKTVIDFHLGAKVYVIKCACEVLNKAHKWCTHLIDT